ncbi:alpha/beta hydrolase [Haladaptatus salinisoli]|uniref:alpha/beta hydrolase n=1 Tax=Haladaptatus salinisoli TaxID=2884876 RepID=UPI001D0A7385|nr:alpha/beta hydrolase [Haladaptatus salinisoli]
MTRTPTRRRVLRAAGVATTTALAGCSFIGGDETTTDAGTTGGRTSTNGTATTDRTTSSGTTETEAGTTATTDETTHGTTETTEETTAGTAPPEGGGDVQFATGGGATVQGTLLGDGSCGVVFAHDAGYSRKGWLPQARRLAENGYACLTIDLNLNDRSTTPDYVLAASRYLRRRVGAKRVVFVGAGAGANAVVRANARAKRGTVDGTLALSPGRAVDSASAMQGWKLFVVSRGDDERFVRTTKRMYENAPGPKRHKIVGGSAHGQRVFETNRDAMWSLMNALLGTVCGDG